MTHKRIAVIASSVALVAAGSGAAYATTVNEDGDGPEKAIIENAAKRLDVSPTELRNALRGAADDQLDQAVKDGKLTQEQADEIKKRRASTAPSWASDPGLGIAAMDPSCFGLHQSIENVAKALGTTTAKLRESLQDGKTIAEIAKANGKDLDDVKKVVLADVSKRLDEAVDDDRLTKEQAADLLKRADDAFDHFATSKPSERKRGAFGGPGGPMGAGPGVGGGEGPPPGIAY